MRLNSESFIVITLPWSPQRLRVSVRRSTGDIARIIMLGEEADIVVVKRALIFTPQPSVFGNLLEVENLSVGFCSAGFQVGVPPCLSNFYYFKN